MKQRLALAVALAASPKILVLDEPTNGLDPGGISDLRETLLSLREAGMTIVVSSHLLPEVERCATRVGIVRAGRVVAQGSVADVLGDAGRIEIAASPDGRAREVAGRFGTVSTDQGALFLDAPSASVADVNRALVEAGVSVHGIARRRRSLEDIVVGGAEVS